MARIACQIIVSRWRKVTIFVLTFIDLWPGDLGSPELPTAHVILCVYFSVGQIIYWMSIFPILYYCKQIVSRYFGDPPRFCQNRNINVKSRKRTDESYFKRYFRIVRLATLYKSFCVNRLIPLIFFSILLIFPFAPMCDTTKMLKKCLCILYLPQEGFITYWLYTLVLMSATK